MRTTGWVLWVGLTACLPTESVRIPAGIDWVTAWSPDMQASEPLIAVEPGVQVDLPSGRGSLVGFTTEQLVDSGLNAEELEGAVLRAAGPCDPVAAEPTWVYGADEALPVGVLTSDALPPLETCPTVDADSFSVGAYEIPDTVNVSNPIGVGRSAQGLPIIVLGDRRVFEVTPQNARFLGQAPSDWVQSIFQTDTGFVAFDGNQLISGSSLETMTLVEDDQPYPSVLHRDETGRLLSISGANGINRINFGQIDSTQPQSTGQCFFSPIHVVEDEPERFVVASNRGWSWQSTPGGGPGLPMGLSRPFARLRDTFVVGDEQGNILDNAADVGGQHVIATVTSVRSTAIWAPIHALESYGTGVIAADELGYLSFVTGDGHVETLAHLLNRPMCLFRRGRDLIVVTQHVNAQIYYSGFRTNVTVFWLKHHD